MSYDLDYPQSRIEKIAIDILEEIQKPEPTPPPTGTINISENGEYDVTEYATANVNVAGSMAGGYTVTFMVNSETYYIASCQQGESITEPPPPQSTSSAFKEWKDKNDNVITFPYVPSADTELTAIFVPASFLVHFDNSVQDETGATATNVQGTPTYAIGKFGQAIVGDGNTTIKYQSDMAFKYDAATSPFTLEFWFYCSTNNDYNRSIFGFADSTPSNDNGLIYANGNKVGLYKGGQKIYVNSVGTNDWHHIAFVFTSTGSKIFVDGELKASNSFVYNTGTSNIASLMGNGNSGLEMLNGVSLDEFAIFPYEKYTDNFTPPTQPY